MKTLKSIKAQLNKKTDLIKSINAELEALNNNAAIFSAIRSKNNELYSQLKAEKEANADREKALLNELYICEIERRILRENAKAALFNEAFPVILAACKKYNGKQYGEATKQKIREEVKKSGYGFYFSGNLDTYKVIIYELTREGFTFPGGVEVEAVAIDEAGKLAEFITKDNKINVESVSASPRSKYVENTAAAAKKIAKAIKAYEEATKDIEKQRRELCNILPEGIKEPEYIYSYSVRF